jgi:hypothetical protein
MVSRRGGGFAFEMCGGKNVSDALFKDRRKR